MIAKLLNAIFSLIISIVQIVLTPLELLIQAILPDLSDALSMVGDFFDYISQFSPIVISYTGLTPATISIIVGLIVATINIPITVEVIKFAVKWFRSLKVG